MRERERKAIESEEGEREGQGRCLLEGTDIESLYVRWRLCAKPHIKGIRLAAIVLWCVLHRRGEFHVIFLHVVTALCKDAKKSVAQLDSNNNYQSSKYDLCAAQENFEAFRERAV
jgi:hypothetical protein